MSKKQLAARFLSLFVVLLMLAGTGLAETTSGVDVWAAYAEPVTVRLAVRTATTQDWPKEAFTSYSDNVWTRGWEKQFNIRTEIMWEADGSTNAYETKLNLAIASKQLPDLIITDNYSQFASLQAAGLLAPLDEVIEQYGYDQLKQNLYADGVSMSIGKVGGVQYGIPEGAQSFQSREVFIRADWMKELNLEAPKTMADVIAIGKAFVDAGKAQYALPLYNKVIDGFGDIMAVANSVNAYPRFWYEKDGKVAYGSVQPEMKQVLSLYADLYKNNYLDKAFASIDAGVLAEQITSGKLGIMLSDFWVVTWPTPTLFEANQADWNIYSVMPYTADDPAFKIQAPENNGKMVCVRAGYEHPEVLLKLLNFAVAKTSDPSMAEAETYHTMVVDGENRTVFNATPFNVMRDDPMTNYHTAVNVTAAIEKNDESLLVSPHDKTQYSNILPYIASVKAGEVPAVAGWTAYKLFYGEDSCFGVFNKNIAQGKYLISATNSYRPETMVRQWGTLVQMEDKFIVDIITGNKGIEAFDEFVKAWNDLGGAAIMDEMNAWYASVH